MNCDFIAPWYEPVEHVCFGEALHRRRTAFLPQVAGARRAISCGEGDGRFAVSLLSATPDIHVTSVDASRKMVRLAEKRVTGMGDEFRQRAEFHFADITSFNAPSDLYDVIATHFFFDCFPTAELARIVPRIAAWAAPHAQWIVSEFHQPPERLGHLWTGAVIRSLYGAFQVTTGLRTTHLPDYRPALASAGFHLQREEQACGGLLVSELWQR